MNLKLHAFKKLQFFIDLAQTLRIGTFKADRRIQLKMPDVVVSELDALFPDTDRSRLLTQLAVDLITHELRFQDRPVLQHVAKSEQSQLDSLWDYLDEREASNTKRKK